jgi:hypothetical protein
VPAGFQPEDAKKEWWVGCLLVNFATPLVSPEKSPSVRQSKFRIFIFPFSQQCDTIQTCEKFSAEYTSFLSYG